MANRKNTFLVKRSNVPNKVPSPGDLQLGELALNTADVILYASGTTANQILPIGWDRLSTTSGGTVNGNVIVNGYVSGTTFYGDGSNLTGLITTDVFVTGGTYSNGTATFTNNTGDTFTVTGFTSTGVTLGSFGITIDGSGSSITPGLKNYLSLPYNGYITGYVIIADQSGSTSIDIWKDNYGSFPPTSGDSITGGNYPSLSSQQINQDTTLSGWTTNFSVGDIICFNVISATTVTRINLTINVTKI